MEYNFETVHCNLCDADDYKVISNKGKFGLPTNVVICKKCGLTYLNPRWDKHSYLRFYQNEYDKYYRPQIQKSDYSNKVAVNPIEIRLKKFGLLPQKVEHILDIGSGEGNNLFHFKSIFPDSALYAIEPSLVSQSHLKKNDVTIIGSDVDTSWNDQYSNKFDIVIMRHVLEHFMDPLQMMKKVRNVLKPSGIVYIAVPNNLNPTQNLEKSWFRNVHTYYFNKYSLMNLNKLVGLETLEMIEGDEFNKGEIYLIAKKSECETSTIFSDDHFEEQITVLNQKLNLENSLQYKVMSTMEKVLRKVVSQANNMRQ
jgi:SAM-dependent methyltransferase